MSLARRSLFRGLAAGALSFAHASRARAARAPSRLLLVMQTGGYVAPAWRPTAGPLGEVLPPSLAPLAPHRGQLCVLPQLSRAAGAGNYGWLFGGAPAPSPAAFPGSAVATLDQIVAARLVGGPPLAIGVGLEPPGNGALPGVRHCFWRADGAPVEPELDPFATYTRLFGNDTTLGAISDRLAEQQSLVRYLGTSLLRLSGRVPQEPRERVAAHLDGVRQLEAHLAGRAANPARACSQGPLGRGGSPVDPTAPGNYPTLVELAFDLATAALACGATRVVTVQLSDASAGNLDAGVVTGTRRGSFHDVATATSAAGVADKRRLDRWHMERFAALLDRLSQRTLAGDACLLDDTLVVWANAEADGRTPELAETPLLLAGRAIGPRTGALPFGRCLDDRGLSLASVLARLAELFGAFVHPYGRAAVL